MTDTNLQTTLDSRSPFGVTSRGRPAHPRRQGEQARGGRGLAAERRRTEANFLDGRDDTFSAA